MKTLHITNGDNTVFLLQDAGVEGDTLPWRDVLHMGPVPETATLDELSEIRAKFIASSGWSSLEDTLESFRQRDKCLSLADEYDEIWLWFEHDLYDQLQVIQVLSELSTLSVSPAKIYMVLPDTYLGHHTPDEVATIRQTAVQLNAQQMVLAQKAWYAFRQPTPEAFASLMQQDLCSLPFLKAAIQRGLLELPNTHTGLTQTEHMALTLISEGFTRLQTLFREYNQRELAKFHGDMSFFWLLDRMMTDEPPLVTKQDDTLGLTSEGTAVLTGSAQWHRIYSEEHWLGGYKLKGSDGWTWDDKSQTLVAPSVR